MKSKKLVRQFLIANCLGKVRKARKLLSIIKKKANGKKNERRNSQRNKSSS